MKETLLEKLSILSVSIGVVTMIVYLLGTIKGFSFVDDQDQVNGYIVILITVVAVIAAQVYFASIKNKSDLSIAYNISIFGFPKSGKTTFITTLFSMIMYRKLNLRGFKPLIKGKSTIEKINNYIKQLEKGIPIQSTTDQTLFAYRLNLESIKRSFLINRNYKVEIGDFPGEHSQQFIDSKNNHFIVESDYFNWAKDADAFIFVIDLGAYLMDKNEYTAEISSAIRSAWQNLLEMNSNNVDKFRKKPIMLILNKVDLFNLSILKGTTRGREDILEAAFSRSKILPKEREIETSTLYFDFQEEVKSSFSNLIDFFESESKNFELTFMSSFVSVGDKKIGFQELINHIIPKN